MEKIDLKKSLRELYNPSARAFAEVRVPRMNFVKVDGAGDPNTAPAYRTAIEWLFSTSYAMKFATKATLGRDYVVPPLEALWTADDPATFVRRDKDLWKWTAMIMVPDFVSETLFADAVKKTGGKLGQQPDTLRIEPYDEGRSLQIMHVGSYDDEGPTLARLHDEIMPGARLTFNGPHHEIYLSDARKTEPSKLKTILRQPVRPMGG